MQRSTFNDITYSWVIGILAGLGILILIGPVLIVITTSFTTSQTLRFPPPDVSLRWYRELFDPVRSAQIHIAAFNSVWVAGLATAIGTVLSVLAALAIARVTRPSARLLEASFLSPLILPTLSYGLAALMFFSVVGIRPSLNLLIAGHLVVIAPGIAAGCFLAFISSMDNVPVSLFLSNARTGMLPIRMWGMMESTLDVRIAAIAGVLILATLVLVIVMDWLTGLTKRMSG
jgi:putative spermidine/putrescine transport system permease protein